MDYTHPYLNALLLLHSAFMLNVVNMPLKGEVSGHALNSHGNYIVYHGKSWKNHGIVLLKFCGMIKEGALASVIHPLSIHQHFQRS